MEGLKELVAASFARYGIECPAGDSQFVWGCAPRAGTAALGCPVERTGVPAALPEHNYKRSSQDICP